MKLGLIMAFALVVVSGCGGSQKTADRAQQDITNGAEQTSHDVETLGPGHGDAGSLNSH